MFNSLCYLVTILLTWLLAGEVFGAVRWKQTLAAGAVALEPQLSYMSAVINADNLLIALTTGFLLRRCAWSGADRRSGRVLAASLLAAAAVLTHGRGLVTAARCWRWRSSSARSASGRRSGTRSCARRVAAGTVGVAFLAYLLLGRGAGSSALYGGQVSELNGTSFNLRQFLSSIYQFYFTKLPSLAPRVGPAYGYKQVFIDTYLRNVRIARGQLPARGSTTCCRCSRPWGSSASTRRSWSPGGHC